MSRTSSALAALSASVLAAPPADLEAEVWQLEIESAADRRNVLRDEAGLLLDRLLTRVARSRGALDVGLCEALAALADGDRLLRLGWSNVGDYARERLGIAPRTAQAMVRLGRGLRERPLLRAAVRAGLVTTRAAQVVLEVATGDDEATWVGRATALTVRGLAAEVRARQAEPAAVPAGEAATAQGKAAAEGASTATTVPDDDEGEPWQRVAFHVTAAARAALDEALAVAGRVLGESSPRWQRLEGIAQEYLGAHAAEDADDEVIEATLATWRGESLEDRLGPSDGDDHGPPHRWQPEVEALLEKETARWAYLDVIVPVAAPVVVGGDEEVDGQVAPPNRPDPAELDESLRYLAGLRTRWEALLGHLALQVRWLGLWRDMQFVSFGHYCRERLGLGLRSVEQRIALERRFYDLPPLRVALEEGRVSTEQARLVARVATERTLSGWLARVEGKTCLELSREVEAFEAGGALAAQMRARCAPGPWTVQMMGAPGAQTGAPGPSAAQTWASGAWAPEAVEPLQELRLRLPVHVAALLAAAFRAAQRVEGRWLSPSESLMRVAQHFASAWSGLPRPRKTPQRKALERDGYRCQVPGCSRVAVQAHHITYRSHLGDDELVNLVSLCAAHHLHGVHRCYLRVRGVAPDGLTWEVVESASRWSAARTPRVEAAPVHVVVAA